MSSASALKDPIAAIRDIAAASRATRKGLWGISLALLYVSVGCRSSEEPFDLRSARYVGQSACIECHREEADQHKGSHHDLAMQLATDESVLGDFQDAQLEHHGVNSRFFRDGERFMVHTEGPDGEMTDFHVKYVFGVEPLQQYMVEFPAAGQSRADGALPRVQVLRLSWDTLKKEWFYLPPPDVSDKLDPHDDLHWTGIAQRWNNMCAECHSTNYQKQFSPPNEPPAASGQPAEKRSGGGHYQSTFTDINVTCEACHGPGSLHIELAGQWFPGWNRQRGYGLANLKVSAENQIQACAPCHSRRNVVQGGFQAGDNFYDFFTNQHLTAGVYYPDGQILDEDYVHGSFIQSKMYHKGIKCTDCHDPHTARLKQEGNRVCTSCHQHPAAKYDSVAHHFHKPGTAGAQCVNCHMPATTYMEVDSRRDHSLRIPRPDLSSQLGSPNACTGCHLEPERLSPEKREQLTLYQDWMLAAREGDTEVINELERVNKWCDDACEKWYGETRRQEVHFGIAIAAGQRRADGAAELLREVLSRRGSESPALARATALAMLGRLDPDAGAEEAARWISDEHPLVRTAAAAVLVGGGSPGRNVSQLESALSDPVRCVRTEAARSLLQYPAHMWSPDAGSAFRRALNEHVEGIEFNNDRSGAHMALGILAEQQGRDQQAMRHYQDAIAVEPGVTGARTNLAALLERNLSQQVTSVAGAAGTLETEIAELRKEELSLLARDVGLLPEAAGLRYRYGLALYVDGQREAAVEHLVAAATLEPERADFAQAAAMLYESLERWDEAITWGERALEKSGDDPQYLLLLNRIRKSAARD